MTRARAVRVLVSARDVGAARQNLALMRACARSVVPVECTALVQEPAASVFRSAGMPATVATPATMRRTIDDTFTRVRPQFVLAGLSGFGSGVDEAVLRVARHGGVPSGAVQDYWGYLGPAGSVDRPDVYFVLDAHAASLTESRAPGVRVEVTGSPKHEEYRERVAEWVPLRRRGAGHRQVVFFMQPRAVPGVMENLEVFLRAMRRTRVPAHVGVRLHPADPAGRAVGLLAKRLGVSAEILPSDIPVEPVLATADLVATCFSTIGLDHNYLQAYTRRSLGPLLYLHTSAPMRRFMRRTIGQDHVPGADVGLGKAFSRTPGLTAWLTDALTGLSERRRYRRAARTLLPTGGRPSARIVQYMVGEVTSS